MAEAEGVTSCFGVETAGDGDGSGWRRLGRGRARADNLVEDAHRPWDVVVVHARPLRRGKRGRVRRAWSPEGAAVGPRARALQA